MVTKQAQTKFRGSPPTIGVFFTTPATVWKSRSPSLLHNFSRQILGWLRTKLFNSTVFREVHAIVLRMVIAGRSCYMFKNWFWSMLGVSWQKSWQNSLEQPIHSGVFRAVHGWFVFVGGGIGILDMNGHGNRFFHTFFSGFSLSREIWSHDKDFWRYLTTLFKIARASKRVGLRMFKKYACLVNLMITHTQLRMGYKWYSGWSLQWPKLSCHDFD